MAATLAHSTCVAAAYVSDAGGAGSGAAGSGSGSTGAATPASPAPAPAPAAAGLGWLVPRPPARRLVGFARAASDRTLVALVADVAVAPAHRRAGVGTRLLAAVLDELRALGIGDVGALASDAQRPFFRRVSLCQNRAAHGACCALLPR